MSGFDDRNRYSYSGADARAYAFYPADFGENSKYPGLRKELAGLYKERDEFRNKIIGSSQGGIEIDSGTLAEYDDIESAIVAREKAIANGLVFLESLATISYQVHEPKAPARALGYRGPKGFARSVRTIAGTMIFIVVEDHPLRGLMAAGHRFGPDSTSYSLDMDRGAGTHTNNNANISISTMIKPFNMLVQYSTEIPGNINSADQFSAEAPPIASYMLENIEIISEGITTSVNDMVTEVVMQFQAHNVYQLSTENSVVETIQYATADSDFNETRADILRKQEAKRRQAEAAYESAVERGLPTRSGIPIGIN